MKLFAQCTAIGAALLLASSPASAVVSSWDFSVSSLFTAATYNGPGGTNPGAGVETLSWGTGTAEGNFAQSSLAVGNSPAKGSVSTYLGLTPPQTIPYLGVSTSLTHFNKPITGTSLTSAILTNSVTLTPTSPAGNTTGQTVPFTIAFAETTNSGTCAVAGSPTPCNDIFVLTGGLLNFDFLYDDNGDGLSDKYYVNIFPLDGDKLSKLEDSACAAVTVGGIPLQPGCIGFTTPERGDTTLAFGFTISTNPLQQVPEPGILALFGLGLMGLFVARRRLS